MKKEYPTLTYSYTFQQVSSVPQLYSENIINEVPPEQAKAAWDEMKQLIAKVSKES